jgi:hypothetical protein
MTISLTEFARLGGKARAATLTAERRKEIARAAGLAQCSPGKRRGRPAKSAKNNSFSTVVEHRQ